MKSKIIFSISLIVINIINSFCPQLVLANIQSKNNEKVKIVDKVISDKDDYVYVDVIIPKISGLPNKNKEDLLNKKIENYTLEWIDNIKLISQENFDTNVKPLSPYEANVRYEIKNNDKLLSFYIEYYQFIGGAHGSTTRVGYTIDTDNGERLNISDLFNEEYDYKTFINKEIQSQINENKDIYFMGKDGFQGIKDNQDFYIEDNDLVVFFQQYEIAPYSTGIPEFHISLESLKK